MSPADLSGYVEVSERLIAFYDRYPDGRIVTTDVRATAEPDGVPRVWVEAAAYRTADDPHPGRGWSWMILPGSTNFTRGSELENTETSAWGRAMAAVGIEVKRGIASASEVRNKEGEANRPAASRPASVNSTSSWSGTVTTGKSPVDGNLRHGADGDAFGFVILEERPNSQYGPKKFQALAQGPLAAALATAWAMGVPTTATVWGEVVKVPWDKDGKAMPPYDRIILTRVQTPEWTLPAQDAAPTDAPPLSDLDDLAW